MRRVVVTGIGMVSPVGATADDSWANLLAGKSGIMDIRGCFWIRSSCTAGAVTAAMGA